MYEPSQETLERLEKTFTYHPPHGTQPERYQLIRSAYLALAIGLVRTCPPSRELSIALTELETSAFWANASIARNETPLPVDVVINDAGEDVTESEDDIKQVGSTPTVNN